MSGARCYFRTPVSAYYGASEKAFVIPGLSDNLIPQGFDYVESEGIYLIGGYQKDVSYSHVYRSVMKKDRFAASRSFLLRYIRCRDLFRA